MALIGRMTSLTLQNSHSSLIYFVTEIACYARRCVYMRAQLTTDIFNCREVAVANICWQMLHFKYSAVTSKTYSIRRIALPVVLWCRDFEVIVSGDLSQSSHITNMIVAKAHQGACFVSRHLTVLTRAFPTYLHPLVEYNSIACSPHFIQRYREDGKSPTSAY